MRKGILVFALVSMACGLVHAYPEVINRVEAIPDFSFTESSLKSAGLIHAERESLKNAVSDQVTAVSHSQSSQKPNTIFRSNSGVRIETKQQRNACSGPMGYSNTATEVDVFYAGANVPVADDVELAIPGGDLTCYRMIVYADPDDAVPPFSFTAAVWNDCPQTGTIIPGTEFTWTGIMNTGFIELEAELPAPIAVPQNIWVSVTPDKDYVAWVMSGEADVGFTDNFFYMDHPAYGEGCNYWFGGDPYAGFYLEMYFDIDLDPCVDCPPEGIPESEPPCGPDYVDTFNGGCNSDPAVFQPIICGDTICGQTGNYVAEGEDMRDTDWFEFTIGTTSLVTWEAYGEVPLMVALIDPGSGNCEDFIITSMNESLYCETATATAVLPAGTYWAFIAPAVFSGYPCEVPYVAELTCVPADPPANDNCEDAEVIPQPYPQIVNGTTIGATIDCPSVLDFTAVWYEFEAPYATNNVVIDFCPSVDPIGSIGVVLYEGPASPGCPTDCNAYIIADYFDFVTCPGGLENPQLNWVLPGPATYLFPANALNYYDMQMDFTFEIDIIEVAPCVSCPPGGIPEGEPPCGADYVDTFNGGCNSDPPVFQPINCGDVICGQTGVFPFGAEDIYRDTDWFEFTIDEFSLVEWDVYGEAPMVAAIIDPMSGNCEDYEILAINTSLYCETAYVQTTLDAGTYWAFVTVDSFSLVYECEVPYVATLTCSPADSQECDPDTIFGQSLVGDDIYVTSDHNIDIYAADDFGIIDEPIKTIEWWGGELFNDGVGWGSCNKTILDFEITFYTNNGGLPGSIIHQESVTAIKYPSPIYVFGNPAFGFVNKYRANLASEVLVTEGWISIVAEDAGEDCWFLWADAGATTYGSSYAQDVGTGFETDPESDFDLAFCLIPETDPPPIPATGPIGLGLLLAALTGLLLKRRK
jgi:hypothetical protein